MSAPSLPPSPAFQTKFTKSIALRDGARLATIDHAQMFLTKLSPTEITAPINYARIILGKALRTGKAKDMPCRTSQSVPRSRLALIVCGIIGADVSDRI